MTHEFSQKNKNDRVRICEQNQAKFKNRDWRLYDEIVTSDESRFYWRQSGKKQSNKNEYYFF